MEPITLANRQAQLPTGETIAYCAEGAKRSFDDPALILLHGFCGSSAYWRDVLPHLADIGKVVVPDLRGHGSSTAPDADVYDMNDFADDIAGLLGEIAEERAVLIGHSLGGYVTLAFAEKYPDKLAGFGLVHSTANADSDAAKANRDKAVETIGSQGIGVFADGLVPKLFAQSRAAAMKEQIAFAKEIGRGTSAAGAAATARGMKVRPDRNAVISGAEVPVLLLAGKEDGVIASEATFGDHQSESVHLVLLDGSGHMGMLEEPERMAAEIRGFAVRLLSGSGARADV